MISSYPLLALALAATISAAPAGAQNDATVSLPEELSYVAPLPISEEELVDITSATEVPSAEVLSEETLEKRQANCASGVYMIVARGSGEPQGPGRLSAVVENIGSRIPGSQFTSVVYPATIVGPNSPLYPDSVRAGIREIQRLIIARTQVCPADRIVLLGYSQGANVVSTGVVGSPFNPRLPSQFYGNIRGIALFADPTQVENQPFNLGTATNGSGLLRRGLSGLILNQFTNRFRQWCNLGDGICATSLPPFSQEVHSNVVAVNGAEAADFIVSVV